MLTKQKCRQAFSLPALYYAPSLARFAYITAGLEILQLVARDLYLTLVFFQGVHAAQREVLGEYLRLSLSQTPSPDSVNFGY